MKPLPRRHIVKTDALSPLRGHEIEKPGKYICLPVSGFYQPVWFTDIYENNGKLTFQTPNGEEREVRGSGHTFFQVPDNS
jgi:hypothetical protein